MLQCVVVWCSEVQCGVVCSSVVHCVASIFATADAASNGIPSKKVRMLQRMVQCVAGCVAVHVAVCVAVSEVCCSVWCSVLQKKSDSKKITRNKKRTVWYRRFCRRA